MGGKGGGGGGGYDYWGADTPSNYRNAPNMGGGGGSERGATGGTAPTGSGQYDTYNAAVAKSVGTEAAKGFGKVALGGMVAPGIFTPTMAVGNAWRAGKNEYNKIMGEQQAPPGTPVIESRRGMAMRSLLDDSDDDDALGGGGGYGGGSANFGGDPVGF